MSSPLKQNTITIQDLLNTVNSLPEANNGVELPELTNEGSASDLLSGKQLINQNGQQVIGTMQNNGIITSTIDGIDTKSITIPKGYTSGGTVSLDNTIDNEVDIQEDLISQIITSLEDKAAGSGTIVDDVSKSIIERTIEIISDSRIKNIGAYTFNNCINLTSVDFSACTNIGGYAFAACSSLTAVDFPACTNIGMYAFTRCSSLTAVDFPACTTIGAAAFASCSSLTAVNFPVCKSIGISAFDSCSSLTSVSFPACINTGSSAFANCSSLTAVNFSVCKSIYSSAFANCNKLSSLTIGTSTVCDLKASNAFTSTPYTGYSSYFSGTPYIYVPASLVSAYKSATNWTYFSSYFSAIGG